MGGHSSVGAVDVGRASVAPPPWASSRPGLPASVLFSTARDGLCAARRVWVRRRAAMTRSDGVDGRYAQRYERRFEPVAWLGVEAK